MSLIAGNLGVIQRLLEAEGALWGVCAGAAAYLYGNRRPIQDIDLLVAKGQLPIIVRLLQSQNKVVQFDGQRILWRGIKVFDDLSIREAGKTYPFIFDDRMRDSRRQMSLLGANVRVLAPEDVFVHKLLMNRGAEQNKHDFTDAQGILRRQDLDHAYLQYRLNTMQATEHLHLKLQELGISFEA